MTASFTATPLKGNYPLTVAFTDTSTGDSPEVSWVWYLGDGHVSTLQNPTYTYTSSAIFFVELQVTRADGSSELSPTTFIYSYDSFVPTFSVTPGEAYINDTITCTSTTPHRPGYAPQDYWWYFGNGNEGITFAGTTPTAYPNPGVFDITLMIRWTNGSLSFSNPVSVTILPIPIPTPTFTYNPESPLPGAVINFTDTTVLTTPAAIAEWEWEFTYPDGTITRSFVQNPINIPAADPGLVLTARMFIYGNWAPTGIWSDYVYITTQPGPMVYPAPYSGMQFFDNNGRVLANGTVTANISSGYAKLDTYKKYANLNPNVNPLPLNEFGRLVTDGYDSVIIPNGSEYNFVVKSSDGTVIQQLNEMFYARYAPGDNITVVTVDPYHNNQQIASSTTDPLFGQGDAYLFNITSTIDVKFDSIPSTAYKVALVTPQNPKEQVVYWRVDGFHFTYGGAYEITTTLNYAADIWPSDASEYGRILNFTDTSDTSHGIRYTAGGGSYLNSVKYQEVTETIKTTQYVQTGEVMTLELYASNADIENKVRVSGTIMITRVG